MDPKQQFQYCSFCKVSHKQKKKHVYSKKHQQIISKILQKFSDKVKSAKMTLDNPDIQTVGYEYGAKFWCYFCVDDYNKHLLLDVCTLKFGGLLEHISEDTHRSSVFTFLQHHRLDEEKQQASKFLLSQDILKKFKQDTEVAIKKYEERKTQSLKKESKLIENEENKRKMLSHTFILEPQTETPRDNIVSSNQHRNVPGVQRKTTLSAHGEGLTFIGTQELGHDEGNVHTEAPPPWLQSHDEHPTRSEIGPTIDDYNKYLKREESKKLPPGRVGAKFDHSGSASSQWLPSFGRVWNTGRRQQSAIFFRKEMTESSQSQADIDNKYDVTKERTEYNNKTGSTLTSGLQLKPYVKKRRMTEEVAYTKSNNGHDFPHAPSASLPNVNPYVREMNRTENIMHHSMGRIDTCYQPLLSNQIVNNVQTNSQIYNPTVQNVTGHNSTYQVHSGHEIYNPTVQNVRGNNSTHDIHSGHEIYNPNITSNVFFMNHPNYTNNGRQENGSTRTLPYNQYKGPENV